MNAEVIRLNTRGVHLLSQGRTEESRQCFVEGLRNFHSDLAVVDDCGGQCESVEIQSPSFLLCGHVFVIQKVAMNSTATVLLYNLGVASQLLGQYSNALFFYDNALQVADKDMVTLQAAAYLNAYQLCLEASEYDMASDLYDRLVELVIETEVGEPSIAPAA